MKQQERHCPLCGCKANLDGLATGHMRLPAIVAASARAHPDWRAADGACPACVQDALHVLLAAGGAALHRQLQQMWLLGAAAVLVR